MSTVRSLSLSVILMVLGLWPLCGPSWAQHTASPPSGQTAPARPGERPVRLSGIVVGQPPYEVVPAKPGERCTICGVLLTDHDVALIVRGRRVPLNKAMVNSFLSNPTVYFSRKQPKSALFQEELNAPSGVAQGGIRFGWFLVGLYILAALIFGGLSGYTAVSKGLPPIPHFFVGLVFSAFGYLYVLTRPSAATHGEIPAGLVKVPATSAPVPCPHCGSPNHPSASHCTGCGATLQPSMQSDVARITAEQKE